MKLLIFAAAVAMTSSVQAQLYREPGGNVVLRSGDTALRFYPQYGGTPLSWYRDGFPVLTNEFPGSGASVAWRTGQDPTQASPNGILTNPISRFDDVTTQRFAYYGRETVFDTASGIYEIQGFASDFWLSAEAPDDAIAPNSDGSETGWRTPYQPGRFASLLASPSRPVIFEGTPNTQAGIFLPADETGFGSSWSSRLRRYEGGRVAFKVQVSLAAANDNAIAGVMFRKSIPAGALSRFDAYMAPGITLAVNKRGGWGVTRMNPSGSETTLTSGTLTTAQANRVKGDGLQLEVRTHNNRAGWAEVWFDDVKAGEFQDPMAMSGPHLALFASTPTGYVTFGNRAVYDVGVELVSRYSPWSGGIVSDIVVRNAGGVVSPHVFDRANMPAIFLNTSTFPESDRRIALYDGTNLTDVVPQSYPMSAQLGFWAGNHAGTAGVLAIPEIVTVDGQPSSRAHCLLNPKTEGGEFVLMLNPLPPEVFSEVHKMRLRVRWASHL